MFKQLDDVERRFSELNHQLEDPAVTSDPKRYRDLMREHSGMQDLVKTYQTYRKQAEELQSAKDIVHTETDSELIAMAKQEVSELTRSVSEL